MVKNIIYIDPESVLWIEVIDNYVYDFCCLSCLLIIQRFYEPKTQKKFVGVFGLCKSGGKSELCKEEKKRSDYEVV